MTSSLSLLAGVVLAALVGGCETRAVDAPVDAGSTPAVDAAIADAGVTQDAAVVDAARADARPDDAMADDSLLADVAAAQVALLPYFDPKVTTWNPTWQYNLFDQGNFSIDLTVTTQDPVATFTMNGGPIVTGKGSVSLPYTLGQQTLVSGPPPLKIVVTSADHRTTTTYDIQFSMQPNVP